jgi:hypothetical protein
MREQQLRITYDVKSIEKWLRDENVIRLLQDPWVRAYSRITGMPELVWCTSQPKHEPKPWLAKLQLLTL